MRSTKAGNHRKRENKTSRLRERLWKISRAIDDRHTDCADPNSKLQEVSQAPDI